MSRLTCSSADQDVKKCYQELITHAANLFESDFGNLLPVITHRLDNEITKCRTLQVVTQILLCPHQSPTFAQSADIPPRAAHPAPTGPYASCLPK
ncbi:hypothetical protein PCASD_21699 [Puccinia coronata f. sp. avenae]|uniref:Uncharacterized protein n=1 Tax=Puccinia coronata f. sp. avenae TaxID=200324 RepID=A0A2N5TRB8_9BASI|nr:hypothetical protein PCASD_21699 [Puccinia coronata f. sp. avenae]